MAARTKSAPKRGHNSEHRCLEIFTAVIVLVKTNEGKLKGHSVKIKKKRLLKMLKK